MARLSWTSWSTLRDCGHHYKLKYKDRAPAAEGSQKNFIVGRVIHEIMQAWVQAGYPADPKFCTSRIRARLLTALREPKTGYVSPEEAVKWVGRIALALSECQKLYRELEFSTHGVIYEQRYNVILQDGKTRLNGAADTYDPVTKTMWDLKNYTSPRMGDTDQLLTYAVAFRRLGHQTTSIGFLFPLLSVKKWQRAVSQEELDQFEVALCAGSKRADDEAFGPPVTGNWCFFCEYNKTEYCPATFRGGPVSLGGNQVAFVDVKDV